MRPILCLSLMFYFAFSLTAGVRANDADENVPSSAGELSRRVAESKQLSAEFARLSPAGRAAFARISKAGERLGRMPTYREYMQELRDAPEVITANDFSVLYWTFSRAQRPFVPQSKLVAIVQQWDHAMRSIELRYDITFVGGLRDGMKSSNLIVADETKAYWDQVVTASPKGLKPHRHIIGYDGQAYRDAQGFGQETVDKWDRGKNVVAIIQPLDTLARFVDPFNPLVRQGLINASRRFSVDDEPFEQFVADSTIYEATEMIDGNECVCVGNVYQCCYLSPKYGFALVATFR